VETNTMATDTYFRGRAGKAIRARALGALARPEDVAHGDAFLDLFDQIDREFRWGTVWSRPGIDKRTRAMLALAMVSAKGQRDAVGTHVRLCLNAGLGPMEIGEILLHVYCYAGAHFALASFREAKRVFDELGLVPQTARKGVVPARTANGRRAAGLRVRQELLSKSYVDADVSDRFMKMFDDVTYEFCFGNIWVRPVLERRMRSQLTLAIAAATFQFGALNRHVRIARRLGLTPKRIGEIFLLAYPYAGAYGCFASFDAARQAFAEIAQERKAAARAKRKA